MTIIESNIDIFSICPIKLSSVVSKSTKPAMNNGYKKNNFTRYFLAIFLIFAFNL